MIKSMVDHHPTSLHMQNLCMGLLTHIQQDQILIMMITNPHIMMLIHTQSQCMSLRVRPPAHTSNPSSMNLPTTNQATKPMNSKLPHLNNSQLLMSQWLLVLLATLLDHHLHTTLLPHTRNPHMRYLVTGVQIPISQYPPHHLLHQPTPKTAIASSLIFLGFSLRPSLD